MDDLEMSDTNDKFQQIIESPRNRNDQNVSSHYFIRQNSQEICNEGKIPDESFNFQNFFENEPKQMNISLNVDLKNSQNTKRVGLKNAYINKINHLQKNIKKKPTDIQKK